MVFGMSLETYTLLHVLISLIGIASGGVVIHGFLTAKRLEGWNALFLLTTILTSVTGFGFPFKGVTPGIKVGIVSLIVLAVAVFARYIFRLNRRALSTYVVAACLAEYLNVFVLVVQSFEKIPFLRTAAPTQTEAPFVVAQLLVLATFFVLTVFSVKRFHPQSHVQAKSVGNAA